jgi:hypothetical protein
MSYNHQVISQWMAKVIIGSPCYYAPRVKAMIWMVDDTPFASVSATMQGIELRNGQV